MGKLYNGVLKRNVRLTDAIEFFIVKEYPEINGLQYIALGIYNEKDLGMELAIVRKLCGCEQRSNFKYSTTIATGNYFFIFVRKAADIKEADKFIKGLLKITR